jgi:uncharacterized protein YaaQ
MTFTPYASGRMKLVILVVSSTDLDEVAYALRRRGHAAVIVDDSGSFGRPGNATLFAGVQESWLFDLLGIVEEICGTRVRRVPLGALLADPPAVVSPAVDECAGGASVYILNVERYERIA